MCPHRMSVLTTFPSPHPVIKASISQLLLSQTRQCPHLTAPILEHISRAGIIWSWSWMQLRLRWHWFIVRNGDRNGSMVNRNEVRVAWFLRSPSTNEVGNGHLSTGACLSCSAQHCRGERDHRSLTLQGSTSYSYSVTVEHIKCVHGWCCENAGKSRASSSSLNPMPVVSSQSKQHVVLYSH